MIPMKLAYLISRFPAVSHTFIQREISALRKQGFEIALFSINPADIAPDKQLPEDQQLIDETFYVKKASLGTIWKGIYSAFIQSPIHFLKAFTQALSSGFYGLFYFIEAAVIGDQLKQKQIHHLHVHFANPASTVALLVNALYEIPFSITVHGPDEFYDSTSNLLPTKFEKSKFIICISFYAQSQVMRLLPPNLWNKVHINRMGIDPSLYAPRKEPNELFTVVSVGRLSISKGQAILGQAIQKLQETGLPIRLLLIGEGPERKWLEKFMNANLQLAGALNPEEVRNALRNANLFVLSSFAEGVPVSLMEAMAMEIPCIAPCINGIPELIIHEKSGLLVYPSDIEGLKEAILKLYHSPNLRETLGKEGRKMVLERYDLTTNTKQLGELLSSEIKA